MIGIGISRRNANDIIPFANALVFTKGNIAMVRNIFLPITSICIFLFSFFPTGCSEYHEIESDRIPLKKNSIQDLLDTEVTPHLKGEISRGKNVAWCATFQVTWNDLCDVYGGEIHFQNEPLLVSHLNAREVTKRILPENGYISASGMVKDGVIEKIEKDFSEKFPDDESVFLETIQGMNQNDLVLYSFLSRDMPFEMSFDRIKGGLEFAGVQVESFGIKQFLGKQRDERRVASQVAIYDYRNKDDFILELKTSRKDDRLILAKIPQQDTMINTIEFVIDRLQNSKPDLMKEGDQLNIPIIDFDLTESFDALCGSFLISSETNEMRAVSIAEALQRIRFRIDEGGVSLRSEAMIAPCINRKFVFDKPYLILVIVRDAELPYFAIWVENNEIMIPLNIL